MNLYKIRSRYGIQYFIQARSHAEAERRSRSPLISRYIAEMIVKAVSNVANVELVRGPRHLVKGALFDDEFFNN